jgi:predicted amidohydrolase
VSRPTSGGIRIAAAQTPEFRGDLEGALSYLIAAVAEAASRGVSLLCLPEGFLQGYLTTEQEARRHALDLSSPAFQAVLDRLPKDGPMIVLGMIEAEKDLMSNKADSV